MPSGVYIRTEEHKRKISEKMMGHTHGFQKGHIVTEEIRNKIRNAQLGSLGNNWRGGIHIDSNGYKLIYKPEHPRANIENYVFEHRLTMEEFLGRYLEPDEIVHHENGVVDDNRPENLILFASQSKHMIYHESLK